MKPEKPITRKEMYLDVATGGSTELPSPVTREEKYLAKIAGESVDIPTPVTRYEMLLAAVAGESYTLTPVTRLEIYLAKAAGQDVEIPQPVTREEMYWFDYCGGTPTPPEREYTGAVPVTFVADGTPLLDYLISGNTAQSGTPTPDSPIMPEGTGDRTGNLFDRNATDTNNGYESGVYLLSSGSTRTSAQYFISEYIGIKPETSYTLVYNTGNLNAPSVCFYDSAKQYISGESYAQRLPVTFTAPAGTAYIRFSGQLSVKSIIMLNTGSEPLPYEPYGYKIPISSANTTTPVYLGEVETTRRIRKLVLTGEETNWYYYENATGTVKFFYLVIVRVVGIDLTGLPNTHGYSTHEITQQSGNTLIRIYAASDSVGNIEEWKSYLQQQYAAGTPVTVWYVLAEPETTISNEPLMRIGNYADTLSMEQAGAQIPTANGSTTLDVETTVKPSEVYIKYRGEAVATLSALSTQASSPEATPAEENPEETEEEENGSEDVSL